MNAQTRPASIRLDGVQCSCGALELRIVTPGTEPQRHDVAGLLARGAPARGWCSVECARDAGWPWLASKTTRKRKTA